MKVLPDIPDHKAQILEDLKEGVEQVKLAKQGKVQLKPVRQLLNEL